MKFASYRRRTARSNCTPDNRSSPLRFPILARGARPQELRRGLPGDADDREARYLEGETGGLVVASIYLPNGNPRPGPRFDSPAADDLSG